jgi:hypothetical protein
MWRAYLKIKAFGVVETTIFHMNCVHRYRDLSEKLSEVLYEVGLDRVKFNNKQVNFYFYYLDKWIYIDDLSKFILNNDSIIIDIDHVYSLVDSKADQLLLESRNKNDIYELYQKIKEQLTRAVIVKKGSKIIDVLDKPHYHYNACVNRMVHTWNY